MELQILIAILCALVASGFTLFFVRRFFWRQTFEEVVAEKRALNEKIYGRSSGASSVANLKKSSKRQLQQQQQSKKDQKREKKQRQREQHQKDSAPDQQEESDEQSENLVSTTEDNGPLRALSKTHVEFDPDPVVVDDAAIETSRRNSAVDKENSQPKRNSKKEKRHNKTSGILINKNEPGPVKPAIISDEPLNTFDVNPPKDAFELKKDKEKEKCEEKARTASPPHQPNAQQQTSNTQHGFNKRDKNASNKREKNVPASAAVISAVEQPVDVPHVIVAKENKQLEVKVRHGSPKNQQLQNGQNGISTNSNNAKNKQKKQKENANATPKELSQVLDKIHDNETLSVSLLMNLFRRAELNRSEIQILIDYLLNKQQDMPDTHSEWSDDICLKLKRQLEESQRALAEEQEASMGLQAKLRELRTEVNTERIQFSASGKAFIEKMQAKEQELAALNQELHALNEKFTLERQQFQSKLMREQQTGSQELLAKLQMLNTEMAHKDKVINELTCMVNSSRQAHDELQQKNDIIQNQAQQLRALEQQRDELEQLSNNRVFELEKAKELETENAERKVEVCNLQNALESAKADVAELRKELDGTKAELNITRSVELIEKQKQVMELQQQIAELTQQLNAVINNKSVEYSKEQTNLQAALNAAQATLVDKDKQLAEFSVTNSELAQKLHIAVKDAQKLIDALKAELQAKHESFNEEVQKITSQNAEQFVSRERELLQLLQEQKEKNNDLRMKNWKLIEALQNAETKIMKMATVTTNRQDNAMLSQNNISNNINANLVQQEMLMNSAAKTASLRTQDEKHMRELLKRLCPEAVESCASNALSLPLDQWIEQVLAVHAKHLTAVAAATAAAAAAAAAAATATTTNFTTTTTATNTAAISSSNKSTQSVVSNNHNNSQQHNNSHNNSCSAVLNNLNSSNSDNNGNAAATAAAAAAFNSNKQHGHKDCDPTAQNERTPDLHEILTQNAQLRARNDELTKLVKKTSITLSELERHAVEQEQHWVNVVHSKDEIIYSLQHSNGEQNI